MPATALPFSRPFAVSSLRNQGSQIAITASAKECAALAQEDGLVAILRLEADFRARRDGRTGIAISGEVRATVTQNCVLSLEPYDCEIRVPVAARFDSAAQPEDIAFGFEDLDPPDPILEGKIDLGAVAAEFLALSLDPYPRKPDAMFLPEELGVAAVRESPFAGLKGRIAENDPEK